MRKTHTILLAAIIAAFASCAAFAADKKAPDAFIASMEGDVKIILTGDTDAQPAKKGLVLKEGDKIKTGADSEALLQWSSGHKIKVYPLTNISIDQLAKRAGSEKISLNVESGKMFAKANKLKSPDSKFSVSTPTAVAGVRGTEFMVNVQEDQTSTVSLLEGSLEVVTGVTETILEANMQLEVMTGMTEPPAPSALPADVKSEMESESKSIGSVEATDGSSESSSTESSSTEETEETTDASGLVQEALDEVISAQQDNAVDMSNMPPAPPMPPDR